MKAKKDDYPVDDDVETTHTAKITARKGALQPKTENDFCNDKKTEKVKSQNPSHHDDEKNENHQKDGDDNGNSVQMTAK